MNKQIKSNVTNNQILGQTTQTPITCIETCAGYGTTRLALEEAGARLGIPIDCIAMSEIDKTAIRAYEALHGKMHNIGDMTKADWKQWSTFVLSVTFPCQSISQANNKKSGKGFEKGANNKSSIVWSLEQILKDMPQKPRLILFENVAAILNKKNKPTLDKLVAYLESVGYKVVYKKLDAQDYGIPQHRERVFILAMLDKEIDFQWPEPIKLPFYLRDVLEKNPEPKYNLTEKAKKGFIERAFRFEHPEKDSYPFRVHNPSKADVAFTISTKSGGRNYDNFVWEHDVSDDKFVKVCEKGLEKTSLNLETVKNTTIRKLTPKEVMTLTGLTDEQQEKLKNFSPAQIFKLMGNGIVVPVLTEVLYQYLKVMKEAGKLN